MALCAAAMALAAVPETGAKAAENREFSTNPCGRETRLREQRESIPNNLLTAISLAESGRWNDEKGESVAWPWTVTANGNGVFFESKKEAVDAVKALQRRGLSNIDVGCMQINLHYHPEAFASLDEAFDPRANVAYAAHFLKALRKDASSWREASGFYHSTTPERAMKYREKLARLSPLARDKAIVAAPDQSDQQGRPRTRTQREIDRLRTAALDAAFRARAKSEAAPDFASSRVAQLADWRAAQSNPALFKKLTAAQAFARQKGERSRAAAGQRTAEEREEFATKRRAQLAAWRRTRAMAAGQR